jgi:site-specific recombinase XerD
MRCGDSTLTHYRYWAGRFVEWLACRGVTEAPAIAAAHVREWLAEDADRLMATSLHARARGVRTLVRFLHAEGYAPTLITFKMPRLEKKRLPCLDAEGVRRVLAACDAARERALVLTLVDSGVGREECSLLDWGDVSFKTEALVVRRGKGGKARLAVVGAKTLWAILAYRRALPEPPADDSSLFRDRCGRLFTGNGIAAMLERISHRSGIPFSAHALRRTFALLSLRAGCDIASLQRLMGHADVAMTSHCLQMIDTDLIAAHKRSGLHSWL